MEVRYEEEHCSKHYGEEFITQGAQLLQQDVLFEVEKYEVGLTETGNGTMYVVRAGVGVMMGILQTNRMLVDGSTLLATTGNKTVGIVGRLSVIGKGLEVGSKVRAMSVLAHWITFRTGNLALFDDGLYLDVLCFNVPSGLSYTQRSRLVAVVGGDASPAGLLVAK